MADLPGHSFESARVRVEAWLTAEGGWELDEGESAGGEGSPPNEETPAEAVTAIVEEDITKMSTITVRPTVVLELSMGESFESGTTDAEKISAIEEDVESRIEAALENVTGIKSISYTFPNSPQAEREGGDLDQSERQAVQTEIAGQSVLIDPAAIATSHVRSSKSLDTTWVASRLYALAGSDTPLYVFIDKYTNTSYVSLDEGVSYRFIVSLDRETLSVNTVVKI